MPDFHQWSEIRMMCLNSKQGFEEGLAISMLFLSLHQPQSQRPRGRQSHHMEGVGVPESTEQELPAVE